MFKKVALRNTLSKLTLFALMDFLVTPAAAVVPTVGSYPSLGQASHNILGPLSFFTQGFFCIMARTQSANRKPL